MTTVAHAAPVAKGASAQATLAALAHKLLAAFASTGFALGVVRTSVASLALYRWHAATEHVATPITSPPAATVPLKVTAPLPVLTIKPPVEVTIAPPPPKKVQAAPSSVAFDGKEAVGRCAPRRRGASPLDCAHSRPRRQHARRSLGAREIPSRNSERIDA